MCHWEAVRETIVEACNRQVGVEACKLESQIFIQSRKTCPDKVSLEQPTTILSLSFSNAKESANEDHPNYEKIES